MKHRILLALVLVCGVFPPSCVAGDDCRGYPCYSIRDSKRYGCFVCALTGTPNKLNWNGKQIVVGEAWIEKRIERIGSLGFGLHTLHKTVPGYHLCFTLAEGWDVLRAPDGPIFVLDNKPRSFGSIGTVVLCEEVEEIDQREFIVHCTKGFELQHSITMKFVAEHRPSQVGTGSH